MSPAKDIVIDPTEKEDDFVEQMDTHDLFAKAIEPAGRKVGVFK